MNGIGKFLITMVLVMTLPACSGDARDGEGSRVPRPLLGQVPKRMVVVPRCARNVGCRRDLRSYNSCGKLTVYFGHFRINNDVNRRT